MIRKSIGAVLGGLIIAFIPVTAFAHVVVTPNQAGVGQELLFNVSVPNEQQTSVVAVKLLMPRDVTSVTPTTKDGWTITTTSNGNGHDPEVTAINWSGTIPVGQRQDFSFSAQVPGNATELNWKAYQTYADGTVVHWDQKPTGSDDAHGDAGPYSVTHVVNDLAPTPTGANTSTSLGPITLGIASIALFIALYGVLRRGKK